MLLAGTVEKGFAPDYQRHKPEQTLLYQIIEHHYPEFQVLMEAQNRPLPKYVQQEFDDYLKCGRLEYGFLRVRCEQCHDEKLVAFSCKRRGFCPSCGARRMADSAALLVDEILPEQPIRQWVLSFPFQLRFLFASYPEIMGKVLGIVNRVLSTHLIHKAGFTRTEAQTGAVTLIQRFGSALNLNIHFHMLVLDGVYAVDDYGKMRFHRVKAPELKELTKLVHAISLRVARFLERRGLLERDEEDSYLTIDCQDNEPMQQLHGHAITYRIALGPQQGRKVFTLQTIPPRNADTVSARVAITAGFSLHAGVATESYQRDKLERLCRYISRPALSENRLSVLSNGNIRYQLKTPYRDGTTHVIFEPLDFIAKLAALTPKPRVNLTRFHGVFAPNSKWREQITPAKRGKTKALPEEERSDKSPAERHVAITWAQRLKRVFNIDIETCNECGGAVKVIACIEDPAVIQKILSYLKRQKSGQSLNSNKSQISLLPDERAPPDCLLS